MTLNLCDDLNIKTKFCYHVAQRASLSLHSWTQPGQAEQCILDRGTTPKRITLIPLINFGDTFRMWIY